MTDIDEMEKEFQEKAGDTIKDLNSTIFELKKEIMFLKKIIRDNELEIEGIPQLSDEEAICLEQMERLKEVSDNMTFDKEQACGVKSDIHYLCLAIDISFFTSSVVFFLAVSLGVELLEIMN